METVKPEKDEEKRLAEIYTQKKERMNLTIPQTYGLIHAWSSDLEEFYAIGPHFTMALARLEGREDEIVTNIYDEFFKEAAVRDYILSRDEFKEELASIMEVVMRDSMNDD